MAEYPYMPLWTDAYLADTRHLTTQQHGAYLLLLMIAWRSDDCSLPNDDKVLARYSGLSLRAWNSCKKEILEMFFLDENAKLCNKRQKNERNFVNDKSKRNRANAEARWLKNNETGDANAYAKPMPNACETHAPKPKPKVSKVLDNPNGSSNTNARDVSVPAKSKNQYSPEFEEFWAAYPNFEPTGHGSKFSAWKAYKTAKNEVNHEEIIRAARHYAATIRERAQRFRGDVRQKHASSWLNSRSWEAIYDAPGTALPERPSPSSERRRSATDEALDAVREKLIADRERNEGGSAGNATDFGFGF